MCRQSRAFTLSPSSCYAPRRARLLSPLLPYDSDRPFPSRPSSPSCHTPILMAKYLRIAQTSTLPRRPTSPRATSKIQSLHVADIVHGPSQIGPWSGPYLYWERIFIWAHSGFSAYVFFVPFCFRSSSLHPSTCSFTLGLYHRTSPHLHHPRRLCAPFCAPYYYNSAKFLHYGHRCPFSSSPCRSVVGGTASVFVPVFFPRPTHFCVEYLSLLSQTRVYNPPRLAPLSQASATTFLPLFIFVCFRSRPTV